MKDLIKELNEINSKHKFKDLFKDLFRVVNIWKVANHRSNEKARVLAEQVMTRIAGRVSEIMPLLTSWVALSYDHKDNSKGAFRLQEVLEGRIETLLPNTDDFSLLHELWCKTDDNSIPEKLILDRIDDMLSMTSDFSKLTEYWKSLGSDSEKHQLKVKIENRMEEVVPGINEVNQLKEFRKPLESDSVPDIIIYLRIEELQA